MTIASTGFAFLAGVLSTLSPCVLPLIPIVLGAAASRHRLGPVALAVGLATSFVVIGLFLATVGFAIGLEADVFRLIAAALMVAIGLVLMVARLQLQFVTAAGPAAAWAAGRIDAAGQNGLPGQFLIGLLLGAVWSPCVGPTLGAASVLAARGEDLSHVAVTMLLFGIGAALPLVLIGLLSRAAMARLRGGMLAASQAMKTALGAILVLVGLAVGTGLDKALEARLVAAAPDWLTALTTRF